MPLEIDTFEYARLLASGAISRDDLERESERLKRLAAEGDGPFDPFDEKGSLFRSVFGWLATLADEALEQPTVTARAPFPPAAGACDVCSQSTAAAGLIWTVGPEWRCRSCAGLGAGVRVVNCDRCGRGFVCRRSDHRRRYCGPDCSQQARADGRRRLRERDRRSGAKTCNWCEGPLDGRRSDALFCSGACRVAAHRAGAQRSPASGGLATSRRSRAQSGRAVDSAQTGA